MWIEGGSHSNLTAFLSVLLEDFIPTSLLSYRGPVTEAFKCRFRNSLRVLENLKGRRGKPFHLP